MGPSGASVIERASLNQAQAQSFPATPPTACQTCPRELVLGAFFDGTGNNMYRDFQGRVGEGQETNVARLFRLYRDHDEDTRTRAKLYVVGVGAMSWAAGKGLANQLPSDQRSRALSLRNAEVATSLPYFGDVVGGATGLGGHERLVIAYRWAQAWCRSMGDGQAKLIDVYGFSRGAAMARTFVNLVLAGLRHEFPRVSVRFLGVFDTVGSFGKGGDDVDVGQNMCIRPGDAAHVKHFTARHEIRENFPLTALGPDREYPGAHSDIGGGYPRVDDDGTSNHLSFVTLTDMYRASVHEGGVEMSALEIPAGVDVEQLRHDSELYWPRATMFAPGGEFDRKRREFYDNYMHTSHSSWRIGMGAEPSRRRRIFRNPARKAVRRAPPEFEWVED